MHLENANLEQLVRHIASTVTNLSQVDRKRIVAIAIGRAISLSLPLPAQALTSTPEAFYDLNHVESVGNAVSKINELYPLNFTKYTDFIFDAFAKELKPETQKEKVL